jgi:DNA repair exonuclease SbcCD ATPase subunit
LRAASDTRSPSTIVPQGSLASTEDVQALDKKIQVLDNKVTEGFERIEYLLLEEQKREIKDLKQRMKRLEDALPAGRPRRVGNVGWPHAWACSPPV